MTSGVPELWLAMRADFNPFLEKAFAELNPHAPFLPNWHIEHLAWEYRLFAEGVTKRLVICMPPRHLKSTIGSVALPAWILGRNPAAKIICASYGEDLGKEFSDQTRRLMNSESYARAFTKVQLEKSTDMHLRTLQGRRTLRNHDRRRNHRQGRRLHYCRRSDEVPRHRLGGTKGRRH